MLTSNSSADVLPGTSLTDALKVLVRDKATQGIVLLGEIGGEAEMEAAAFLTEWRRTVGDEGWKPVVGMVTGRTAPMGKTMGHAGAVAGEVSTSSSYFGNLFVRRELMHSLLSKEGNTDSVHCLGCFRRG